MKRTRLILWLGAVTLALLAGVASSPAWAIGTPAGTDITNQATVDFTDVNGNARQALSNVVTTTVSQVAAVVVDPDDTTSADPGDTLYFAHVVTNNGNGDDTIDLTVSSVAGYVTAIYLDVNGNGAYDAGTDTLLTDSDGDTVPDSGLLAHDTSMRILIEVQVPGTASNGDSAVFTVTGTSSFNTGVADTATDTINVQAPDVTVVKSVLPAGPQPPGTVLTYTIVVTNNGAGAANGVVLTDPIPANTTYQAGSITLDAGSLTDGADADAGDYNVTNAGQVTVSLGSLAASGGTATVTFSVSID